MIKSWKVREIKWLYLIKWFWFTEYLCVSVLKTSLPGTVFDFVLKDEISISYSHGKVNCGLKLGVYITKFWIVRIQHNQFNHQKHIDHSLLFF